jgi:hypothetical protein
MSLGGPVGSEDGRSGRLVQAGAYGAYLTTDPAIGFALIMAPMPVHHPVERSRSKRQFCHPQVFVHQCGRQMTWHHGEQVIKKGSKLFFLQSTAKDEVGESIAFATSTWKLL